MKGLTMEYAECNNTNTWRADAGRQSLELAVSNGHAIARAICNQFHRENKVIEAYALEYLLIYLTAALNFTTPTTKVCEVGKEK